MIMGCVVAAVAVLLLMVVIVAVVAVAAVVMAVCCLAGLLAVSLFPVINWATDFTSTIAQHVHKQKLNQPCIYIATLYTSFHS